MKRYAMVASKAALHPLRPSPASTAARLSPWAGIATVIVWLSPLLFGVLFAGALMTNERTVLATFTLPAEALPSTMTSFNHKAS